MTAETPIRGFLLRVPTAEDRILSSPAVQIGTANFIDPAVTVKVVAGINDYLERHGYASVEDIVGALEV